MYCISLSLTDVLKLIEDFFTLTGTYSSKNGCVFFGRSNHTYSLNKSSSKKALAASL